jgi:hypothetical protein
VADYTDSHTKQNAGIFFRVGDACSKKQNLPAKSKFQLFPKAEMKSS